jgi:hypothetical protein
MRGNERRRGGIFTASGAGCGWSDPAVSRDDGFLEGGQSWTRGIRHGRRFHAVTIPIEVAEIGRGHPTLKRPLCAGRAFELTEQPYAQRAPRLARLLGQSSCSNNPHRGDRNRSVGPPAVHPLRARCAPAGLSGDSRASPTAIPRRRTGQAAVRGGGCGLPPLESSCPNNPHRGARNWSRPSDSGATLVRPQGGGRPSGRLQSDSKATLARYVSQPNPRRGQLGSAHMQ